MAMTEEAKAAQRAYQREYRKKNRDRVRAYQREYRKNHKDQVKQSNAKYWAKRAAAQNQTTEEPEDTPATISS